MKAFILCSFLVVMCLILEAQGTPRNFNKREAACGKVVESSEGQRAMIGCGTYQCAEGKQIGYKEVDLNKPYPECCGGPICRD